MTLDMMLSTSGRNRMDSMDVPYGRIHNASHSLEQQISIGARLVANEGIRFSHDPAWSHELHCWIWSSYEAVTSRKPHGLDG
jgi:hypothetical protein